MERAFWSWVLIDSELHALAFLSYDGIHTVRSSCRETIMFSHILHLYMLVAVGAESLSLID